MADALDAVLNLVDQHNKQQQLGVDNFYKGVDTLNQQIQNMRQNQLGQLQVKAQLAQSALQLNPDNSISYNQNYVNPNTQFQTLLAGQGAARTAGNVGAYQMYSGILNRLTGSGQSPAAVTSAAVASPQLNQLLSSGNSTSAPAGIGSFIPPASNAPAPGNGNIVTGGSVSTDPVSGLQTGSSNVVNLPAKALEATQTAQIPNQVAADKAATEAQTQASARATDYKNIYSLAQNIDKAGYLGSPVGTSAYKLSPRLAPPDVQSNIAELETAIKRESQSSAIADTATFGEGVAKRINAGQENIGKDSTIGQIKGWIKGNITSDYYKEIGTKQFSDELAKKGLNPNQVTPDQFGAGVMKYWGKLNPDQEKELKTRVMTTLAPPNAAGFGLKSDKYYDAQGKEINQ